MQKRSIIIAFAAILILSLTGCMDWMTGGGDDDEKACKKQFECGLLDDEEAMKDCSIGVKSTRDELKVVKGNDDACEDLREEFEAAIDCIADLSPAVVFTVVGSVQTGPVITLYREGRCHGHLLPWLSSDRTYLLMAVGCRGSP